MNILFLAPQPYYSDRGTPIAVDCLLQVLSKRGEIVDVLTYHEGKNITRKNITIHRILNLAFVKNIRPGLSWKKIVCDAVMILTLIPILLKKRYQLIHAVEESVFMALLIKLIFKTPFVYDMDSSLSQQVTAKFPFFKPLITLLEFIEKMAVKGAIAVIPVCPTLEHTIKKFDKGKKSFVLHDISLLDKCKIDTNFDLKKELGISGLIVMYIGNLEYYQGIDLLLESFEITLNTHNSVHLVIIGGENADINNYKDKSSDLGINQKVHFLGAKPLSIMGDYIHQADVLVSPRIKGNNTPMKIYTYLHTAIPVLATKIGSHTQMLTREIAMLAPPTKEEFGKAMITLIEDEGLRAKLGRAGKWFVDENHSFKVFEKKVNQIYDWIQERLACPN